MRDRLKAAGWIMTADGRKIFARMGYALERAESFLRSPHNTPPVALLWATGVVKTEQ